MTAAVEWTTFDRRPPGHKRARPQARSSEVSSDPWVQRRRAELAVRGGHPDFGVYGVVIPFDVALDDGRGHRLVFTSDTTWLPAERRVPLRLEHDGRWIGSGRLNVEPGGLVLDGTVPALRRDAIGERRHLSVGLGPFDTRRRADGVLEVTIAELREVSMVGVARWAEHCAAYIWQRPASA